MDHVGQLQQARQQRLDGAIDVARAAATAIHQQYRKLAVDTKRRAIGGMPLGRGGVEQLAAHRVARHHRFAAGQVAQRGLERTRHPRRDTHQRFHGQPRLDVGQIDHRRYTERSRGYKQRHAHIAAGSQNRRRALAPQQAQRLGRAARQQRAAAYQFQRAATFDRGRPDRAKRQVAFSLDQPALHPVVRADIDQLERGPINAARRPFPTRLQHACRRIERRRHAWFALAR